MTAVQAHWPDSTAHAFPFDGTATPGHRPVHVRGVKTVVCALALSLWGCPGKDDTGEVGPRAGLVAPQLQGKTLDGDYIQLTDFAGKVVLVNVWATWCKPCVKELPELARLHKKLPADEFTVLGVSVDKVAAKPLVRRFVGDHDLSYPMIFDPDGRAVGAFSIKGYPTSLLIGRDGMVRWRRDGIIKKNDGELGKQIELALDQPKPESP